MSDTVVARLRERIETERDAQGLGIGLDAVAVDLDDLAALLDVVERFAAAGVMVMRTTNGRGIWFCAICGGASHAPTCPWLAARRLCGMEAAK